MLPMLGVNVRVTSKPALPRTHKKTSFFGMFVTSSQTFLAYRL